MSKSNLATNYVKGIEEHNSHLENENMRLQRENERMLNVLKQLQGAGDDLNKCLSLLLEKYGSDKELTNIIMKTLNEVGKKMSKEKY
jgi:hypothetical protein